MHKICSSTHSIRLRQPFNKWFFFRILLFSFKTAIPSKCWFRIRLMETTTKIHRWRLLFKLINPCSGLIQLSHLSIYKIISFHTIWRSSTVNKALHLKLIWVHKSITVPFYHCLENPFKNLISQVLLLDLLFQEELSFPHRLPAELNLSNWFKPLDKTLPKVIQLQDFLILSIISIKIISKLALMTPRHRPLFLLGLRKTKLCQKSSYKNKVPVNSKNNLVSVYFNYLIKLATNCQHMNVLLLN